MVISEVKNAADTDFAQKCNIVVLFFSFVRPAWRPSVGAFCCRSAVLSGSRHAQCVLRMWGDAHCSAVSFYLLDWNDQHTIFSYCPHLIWIVMLVSCLHLCHLCCCLPWPDSSTVSFSLLGKQRLITTNSSLSLVCSEGVALAWCWLQDVLAWLPPPWWSFKTMVDTSCTMSSSPLSQSSLCSASCSCLKVNVSHSQTHWRKVKASAGHLSSFPSLAETTFRYSALGPLCRSTTPTTIRVWSLPPGRCWLKILYPTGLLCQLTLLCCQIVNPSDKRMRHWEKICLNSWILLIFQCTDLDYPSSLYLWQTIYHHPWMNYCLSHCLVRTHPMNHTWLGCRAL